ncbi:MAG: helix-turn-helix domain-containing protein [Methylocella sp.]
MLQTDAFQGVRMIKFLSILSRYEAAELNQLEAAELLGMSARTFRRWRRRFEDDGEAGLAFPAAGQVVRQAGSD